MNANLIAVVDALTRRPDWVARIGWMLVDSLWQFALVAVVLVLALRVMARASSRVRYVACLIALAAFVLLPCVTWIRVVSPSATEMPATELLAAELTETPPSSLTPVAVRAGDAIEHAPSPTSNPVALRRNDDLKVDSEPARIARASQIALWRRTLEPWLTTLVGAWLTGVAIFSLRPLLSGWTVRRLRRVATSPVSERVQALFNTAASKIGVRSGVRVMQSGLLNVPAVVGYFRPIVLVPLAVATSFPPDQLEAVLVHELAHIRRHDYLVNLLQTAIETLFFYHPAVWWVSRQIRREREECCDDVVLSVCRSRSDYAKALISLEELRAPSPVTALAASGGSLVTRIRRITGAEDDPRPGLAAIVSAGAALVAFGFFEFSSSAAELAPAEAVSQTPAGAALQAPTSAAQANPFRAVLGDGAEFEIVGVSEHPSTGRPWWRADGSPLENGPREPFNSRVNGGPQSIHREFVVDARHAGGTTVETHMEGGGSAAASSSQTKEDGRLRDRSQFAMAFANGVRSATAVIAYASGPWNSVAQCLNQGGSGVAIGSQSGGVVFGEPVEVKGEVQIPVSYDLKEPGDVRVVAVDEEGHEHSAVRQPLLSAHNANLMTAGFGNLTLSKIKLFRLQSRRSRRIEFRNIALDPGQNSRVEILIDGKPYVPKAGATDAKTGSR